tara:strand:+ start:118 stop:324 length:207 start_codon:yes stop_codon:yes gene_type:complete
VDVSHLALKYQAVQEVLVVEVLEELLVHRELEIHLQQVPHKVLMVVVEEILPLIVHPMLLEVVEVEQP